MEKKQKNKNKENNKENKKTKNNNKNIEKEEEKKNMLISLFILAIMIFSVVGFAFMSGGSRSGNNGEMPSEIPFQEFKDPSGKIFWGAIRNSEQFIFENIDGFEEAEYQKRIANKIKEKNKINLYIESNFTSSDSVYLIKKALTGLKIEYNEIRELNCQEDTLVVSSFNSEMNEEGKCILFKTDENPFEFTNILIYHLIK